MKNNTTFVYADNGIIVRYEDDGSMDVMEQNVNLENTFLKQIDLTEKQKTIGLMYGGIVTNSLRCFDDEILQKVKGFRVQLEITPIFETKDLYKHTKK